MVENTQKLRVLSVSDSSAYEHFSSERSSNRLENGHRGDKHEWRKRYKRLRMTMEERWNKREGELMVNLDRMLKEVRKLKAVCSIFYMIGS